METPLTDDTERPPWFFNLAAETLLVVGFFFIIYAALPTRNYYWDGLIYGEFLERSDGFSAQLFHPNHLLYNFVGYAAFQGLQELRIVDRALFALQYGSIFFGAVSGAIFYLIGRQLFHSIYVSLVATGVLGFSAAWWRFATDADVYVISICFLLLSFYLMIAACRRPLLAAIAFVAAMLFHELAILFFPAAVATLWLTSDESRERWLSIVKFGALSGVLIASVYLWAFWLTHGFFEIRTFARWMTAYAGTATVGPDIPTALRWMAKGTRQLFVDGSTNLVERGLISDIAIVLFSLAILALLISLAVSRSSIRVAFVRAASKFRKTQSRLAIICLAWIVPYVCFLLAFEPGNTFYRLFYLPPLVLLFGAFVHTLDRQRGTHYIAALLMCVFALYNFVFYIYPNSQPRAGTVVALALDAEKVWDNKTLVFFEPQRPTEGVIRTVIYFNPAAVWRSGDSLTVEVIKTELPTIYPQGGSIWFEKAAFERIQSDPVRFEVLLSELTVDPDVRKAAPKHNLEFIKLVPRGTHESIK